MRDNIELLIHFIVTLIKLLKPGGVKALIAENQAKKKQLLLLNSGRKGSPPLTTSDRFMFGFLAIFISEKQLQKIAVIFKPATIIAFHKALVKRKYSK